MRIILAISLLLISTTSWGIFTVCGPVLAYGSCQLNMTCLWIGEATYTFDERRVSAESLESLDQAIEKANELGVHGNTCLFFENGKQFKSAKTYRTRQANLLIEKRTIL